MGVSGHIKQIKQDRAYFLGNTITGLLYLVIWKLKQINNSRLTCELRAHWESFCCFGFGKSLIIPFPDIPQTAIRHQFHPHADWRHGSGQTFVQVLLYSWRPRAIVQNNVNPSTKKQSIKCSSSIFSLWQMWLHNIWYHEAVIARAFDIKYCFSFDIYIGMWSVRKCYFQICISY